jgi:hypothetical protein
MSSAPERSNWLEKLRSVFEDAPMLVSTGGFAGMELPPPQRRQNNSADRAAPSDLDTKTGGILRESHSLPHPGTQVRQAAALQHPSKASRSATLTDEEIEALISE